MSDVDEKGNHTPEPIHDQSTAPLLGRKSPGVERIEAISHHITFANRIAIFLGVFLIAYAYGLDGTLRYAYQVSYHPRCSPRIANCA